MGSLFKPNRRHMMQVLGGGALTMVALPSVGQHVQKEVHDLKPNEFTWHPDRQPTGPVSVIVSLDEQLVHVYRNGVRIAVSTCSTGKKGHATPTGVFVVLQKDRDHRSSTYNNAPMPNMNRLTWSGIALHAGNLPGYPASHGCVRLPYEFSARLFEITHLGTPVIIADRHHSPDELVHPGMVLSGFAEDQFRKILSTLSAKKHPSDWKFNEAYPITTIIASSKDKQIILIENDVEIAQGPLIWDGKPIGPHTFVLKGEHESAQGLHWTALTGGASSVNTAKVLNRVKSNGAFNQKVHEHAHPGMIFILTDLPLHPDSRSGKNFVIMS